MTIRSWTRQLFAHRLLLPRLLEGNGPVQRPSTSIAGFTTSRANRP
jgi:hypothetical protein